MKSCKIYCKCSKGHFVSPYLKDEAMRWGKLWGFVVISASNAEEANCG